MGSFPPGLTVPVRTSAIASAPPRPGAAWSTAGLCSWAHSLPHGLPVTRISTTGVPVSMIARTRSSWTPGKVEGKAIAALAWSCSRWSARPCHP